MLAHLDNLVRGIPQDNHIGIHQENLHKNHCSSMAPNSNGLPLVAEQNIKKKHDSEFNAPFNESVIKWQLMGSYLKLFMETAK